MKMKTLRKMLDSDIVASAEELIVSPCFLEAYITILSF